MSETLIFKLRRSTYTIPLESIVYMENELRRIRLYTMENEYLFYGTFQKIGEQLDERFVCCSRSYILNNEHIRAMALAGDQYTITMSNGRRIYLSKNSFLKIRCAHDDYLKQKKENERKDP